MSHYEKISDKAAREIMARTRTATAHEAASVIYEAADEILALRAEVKSLQEALAAKERT